VHQQPFDPAVPTAMPEAVAHETSSLLQRRSFRVSSDAAETLDSPVHVRVEERSMRDRLVEVTKDYLPLAVITFGGPPAHIAILHDRFVVQKKWLSERMFAELLAVSSALPGPASTQLAYTVALIRDGVIPAIWAFCLWRYAFAHCTCVTAVLST
jgi:Chromate transporter